jgi:hypothetical protein
VVAALTGGFPVDLHMLRAEEIVIGSVHRFASVTANTVVIAV